MPSLNLSNVKGMQCHLLGAIIYIYLVTNVTSFHVLICHSYGIFSEVPIQIFCPLLTELSYNWVGRLFKIQYAFCKYFLPNYGLPRYFLSRTFEDYKFFILIKYIFFLTWYPHLKKRLCFFQERMNRQSIENLGGSETLCITLQCMGTYHCTFFLTHRKWTLI